MSTSSIITGIGIAIILTYSIVKILDFYGINIKQFETYLSFYVFILITLFVLPRQYPTLE
jgi:hypothetical protein